ncbi:hypothetical protein HAP94_24905 [Acidithiobacillus ferrivorans]|nr:hypothetical protein [Acidithiobacillus ferrivorans]
MDPDNRRPVDYRRRDLLHWLAGAARGQDRGRERRLPSPPSEPGVRFSRDGLSSQLFPHRDWRAN